VTIENFLQIHVWLDALRARVCSENACNGSNSIQEPLKSLTDQAMQMLWRLGIMLWAPAHLSEHIAKLQAG